MKTNLVFFNEGGPTERIWYYDLSHLKVTKRQPLTLAHFDEFFHLLPARTDSEHSWTVDYAARWRQACDEAAPLVAEADTKQQAHDELIKTARALRAKAWDIKAAATDLKAINLNAKNEKDTRTPAELIEFIDAKGREVGEALAALRGLGRWVPNDD